MDDDAKRCSSCAKPLPADAVFCSACGAQQRSERAAHDADAFELADEGTTPVSPPAVAEETPAAAPPELEFVEMEASESEPPASTEIDSDLLEIEFDAADGEEGDAPVAAAPAAPTPAPEPAADDDEAPQTGETVRMKMSDVVQAWNEEAGVEEDASGAPPAPAPTGGLPKGAIVAILAIVAVMAMVLYFLV